MEDRFVLETSDTVDEVEVAVQPAAMVALDGECDTEEINSACIGGLACVDRFCVPTE